MCKRNSPQKNEVSKGCVSEIPEKEKKKKKEEEEEEEEAHTGYVREPPHIKMKLAQDV